jgi:L-2-hydroxyglutarate oxidase
MLKARKTGLVFMESFIKVIAVFSLKNGLGSLRLTQKASLYASHQHLLGILGTKGRIVKYYDVIIVGAGIIGLASARSLKSKQPNLKILVCEKESEAGQHASGRNSGVLHAGFYYSPDSMKAQFCRDGNIRLREFIRSRGIALVETGKVVVTKSEQEEKRLEALYERGITNGVKLELLPASQLEKFEPLARTTNTFLWSPTTAVSDPKSVTRALVEDLVSHGVEFNFSTTITEAQKGRAFLNGEIIRYGHLINAAGSQADRIAHQFGVGVQYTMLPFIGLYRYVEKSRLPLRTLVYPVPHPLNPFLGVHFTVTHDGLVKIGPTAIPIVGREQYKLLSNPKFGDVKSTIRAAISLITGTKHNVRQIVASEFPKYSSRFLVNESSKLVPAAQAIKGWGVKPPGIRSQLVNLKTGELVQDFLIEKGEKSTHILNAVSPGWTSAFAFGSHVADQALLDL